MNRARDLLQQLLVTSDEVTDLEGIDNYADEQVDNYRACRLRAEEYLDSTDDEAEGFKRKVWRITGTLHAEKDGNSHDKDDNRAVYLAHPSFPDEETAKRALLHNWSSQEHSATVTSINPAKNEFAREFYDEEHLEVLVLDGC